MNEEVGKQFVRSGYYRHGSDQALLDRIVEVMLLMPIANVGFVVGVEDGSKAEARVVLLQDVATDVYDMISWYLLDCLPASVRVTVCGVHGKYDR